jgi:hypothetical protein
MVSFCLVAADVNLKAGFWRELFGCGRREFKSRFLARGVRLPPDPKVAFGVMN